ncbi:MULTISPECIES: CsbD family protein [unclassified Streptomyces]|uniref:CsbD family protein n=1 Tax=unclassified Streptomyces TaxID=2593676 RepID=UPI0032D57082
MSTRDKAENTADKAKGKIKEAADKTVGNERLEPEGRAEQAKGDVKQAGEHVEDAFDTDTTHGAAAIQGSGPTRCPEHTKSTDGPARLRGRVFRARSSRIAVGACAPEVAGQAIS